MYIFIRIHFLLIHVAVYELHARAGSRDIAPPTHVVKMAVEELPLVDVNVETVEHTWPLLLRAVEQADFVALDLVRLVPHEPRTWYPVAGDFVLSESRLVPKTLSSST